MGTKFMVTITESPDKEQEIEFLRVGTHTATNGSSHSFTHDIAQEIVDTYNPDNFKAPLIVSHRTGKYSDRSLVDSELAFGTPKFLKKVGDRVKAVFEKISPDFVEWVRNNQILGISPSFYPPEHQSNPTPGKWSLRHIAGLGVSPPAIKGLAALSLSEFLTSQNGAINLGEFDLTDESGSAIALDFMGSDSYEVFSKLRDYLIEKEGVETGDRIIPSFYLQLLNEPQQVKSDYPFELIEQLMMRVSDLEMRLLNPMPLNQIYSEPINFATPTAPSAAKKKNCTKGTACGGSCISASKTCKKKQSPDNKAKTKGLKEKMASSVPKTSLEKAQPGIIPAPNSRSQVENLDAGSALPRPNSRSQTSTDIATPVAKSSSIEAKRPTKEEAKQMTVAQREALRAELRAYDPPDEMTTGEKTLINNLFQGNTDSLSSLLETNEMYFVNGIGEEGDNSNRIYNAVKKYKKIAPVPSGKIYRSSMDYTGEGFYKVGEEFNEDASYRKFNKNRRSQKGDTLFILENKTGFETMHDSDQVMSSSVYKVKDVKKERNRTIVTIEESDTPPKVYKAFKSWQEDDYGRVRKDIPEGTTIIDPGLLPREGSR